MELSPKSKIATLSLAMNTHRHLPYPEWKKTQKKERVTCFNKENVRLVVHKKTDFPVPLSLPYIKHSTFPLFNSEPSRNKTEIDLSFQKKTPRTPSHSPITLNKPLSTYLLPEIDKKYTVTP